jgi:hypothetical protein
MDRPMKALVRLPAYGPPLLYSIGNDAPGQT